MKEVIKPVPDHEGYFVSNFGRVFSNRPKNGKGDKPGPLRELKGLLCSKGRYFQFGIGKKKFLIHRVVAHVFIGQCPEGCEVSHIDGDSFNNKATNLEYVSHKENEKMKLIHGTRLAGDRSPQSKLSSSQVREIRERLKKAKRGEARKLSKEFNVCESTISLVKKNKRWEKEEF